MTENTEYWYELKITDSAGVTTTEWESGTGAILFGTLFDAAGGGGRFTVPGVLRSRM